MNEGHWNQRQRAIAQLRELGIQRELIYLIDLVPLIEMIWADGLRQDSELALLEDFAARHVDRVNLQAGWEVLSHEDAKQFIARFVDERPDPNLLAKIRKGIRDIRLSNSDERGNEALRASILASCLDIASCSVVRYPYGPRERFDTAEKRCFFQILEDLALA